MRETVVFICFFSSLLACSDSFAQDEPLEMWVKLSPEIRLNFEDFPFRNQVAAR
jgi:hypothetical protein